MCVSGPVVSNPCLKQWHKGKAMNNVGHSSPSAGEEGSQNFLFCSLPKSNLEISCGCIGKTKAWWQLKLTRGVKVKKDIERYVSCKKQVQEIKSCPATRRSGDLVVKDIENAEVFHAIFTTIFNCTVCSGCQAVARAAPQGKTRWQPRTQARQCLCGWGAVHIPKQGWTGDWQVLVTVW